MSAAAASDAIHGPATGRRPPTPRRRSTRPPPPWPGRADRGRRPPGARPGRTIARSRQPTARRPSSITLPELVERERLAAGELVHPLVTHDDRHLLGVVDGERGEQQPLRANRWVRPCHRRVGHSLSTSPSSISTPSSDRGLLVIGLPRRADRAPDRGELALGALAVPPEQALDPGQLSGTDPQRRHSQLVGRLDDPAPVLLALAHVHPPRRLASTTWSRGISRGSPRTATPAIEMPAPASWTAVSAARACTRISRVDPCDELLGRVEREAGGLVIRLPGQIIRHELDRAAGRPHRRDRRRRGRRSPRPPSRSGPRSRRPPPSTEP